MSPQPLFNHPAIAAAEAAKYLGIRQADRADSQPVTFVSHSNRKHAVSAKERKKRKRKC